MIAVLIFIIICIEIMVVSCCAMAGNDPFMRMISDMEQILFIKRWNEEKQNAKKDRLL